MRHFFKTILLVFGVLVITFSCQKNDEIIEPQNIYDVPSIEAARLYFKENSNLVQSGTNHYFRNTTNTINTDWDNSKAKKYKEEPQENLDILYTPLYLPTSGHAKSFIGTVEVNGQMQSKIFVLIYTANDNRLAFSGFMFVYDLDGAIEHAYKYQEGQQVAHGLPSLTTGNLNRTSTNDGCDFPLESMDCLLAWIGGDWFGLDGFIHDDTIVLLDSGDSSTGGQSIDGDLGTPSINIPALGDDSSAGGNPWWNGNTVSDDALAIALALELEHLAMPEAQWLLNEASQEQLQNIANFLNANRVKENDTPVELAEDGIDPNQMTEISQEAIDFALFIISVMIDNSEASFEFDPDLIPSSNYQNFDNLDEAQDFFDAFNNPVFSGETIIDPNDPQRVVAKFSADISTFANVKIYVTQDIGNNPTEYSILEVSTAMTGFTLGLDWTQDAWDYEANQYQATVNIYGHLDYIFFFKGIGTVFSEDLHYQADANVADGSEISAEKIN